MSAEAWSLIDTAGLAELDRSPRLGVATVADLTHDLAGILSGLTQERSAAGLGLALLWHDHHDAAHELCQAHEGDPDCDYVHALLHRREGDYGNAKYWFRAVDDHPISSAVAEAACALGHSTLLLQGRWQPAAMVDACARACGGDIVVRKPLKELQAAEFRALANYLFTR